MRLGKKFIKELIILRNVLRPGIDKDGLISDDKVVGIPTMLPMPGRVRLVGSKIGAVWLKAKSKPRIMATV